MISIKIKKIVKDQYPFLVIFSAAFAIRLGYLFKIKDQPFYIFPLGDSAVYYQRALEILSGKIINPEVPFLGSVFYPYFMSAVLLVSNQSLFFVSLIQIIFGSLACCLVWHLSWKLSKNRTAALLSGLTAAFYGPLVFLDADLLMISITVMSVAGGLLFLVKAREEQKTRWAMASGLLLGLACLDRANLILFIPAGAFYLYSKRQSVKISLGLIAAFLTALLAVALPVTISNSLHNKDLSLTGSNMGINFYIGNNPEAPGVFMLPESSGLENSNLYQSSKAIAEKEAGRELKPPEVSRYWLGRGLEFIISQPLAEARLMLKKIGLFFNAYEIPNHLNFYFIKREYAPILNIAFLGFWFVGPLALAGIFWLIKDGISGTGRLYLSFLIIYLISLLPFFIADRYRLPIVPVMIVFAWDSLIRLATNFRLKQYPVLTAKLITIITMILFVNWPILKFTYSSDRIEVSRAHLEKAMAQKDPGGSDNRQAIEGLKWALEASQPFDPWRAPGHFHLARAYAYQGYYSGAIRELEKVKELRGTKSPADAASQLVKNEYERTGDLVRYEDIPQTPFERAQGFLKTGNYESAIPIYREIINRDPFHLAAINSLGLIYYNMKQYRKALQVLNRGRKIFPDNEVLNENICHIYRQMGQHQKADRVRKNFIKKCQTTK
ncbi:MAG: glycosyltransferase family 39 protein [Candidatus Edwardsbacteria bacterium]|nr:glycosyltransferase family 39 protein [Candidatus Edwardsbacteria bacterium]